MSRRSVRRTKQTLPITHQQFSSFFISRSDSLVVSSLGDEFGHRRIDRRVPYVVTNISALFIVSTQNDFKRRLVAACAWTH
eukprot:6199078-Pleurochrysis_carterae.AAC.1